MIFDFCSICGQHIQGIEETLVNGEVYHLSCYKKLLNNISENQKRIIFAPVNKSRDPAILLSMSKNVDYLTQNKILEEWYQRHYYPNYNQFP